MVIMMKIFIIQPEYSTDYSRSEELFEKQLSLMDACDDSADIIVMPESCDIPAYAKNKEESEKSVERFNKRLLEKASETAKRCSSLLFANARSKTDNGYRNTTYAFDRNGQIVGMYHKQHLVPGEVSVMKLDSEYSFEFSEPEVIEIEGIRFAFLVCYDFYFYEAFANIARQNVDVIIGCSHQRSDTHEAIAVMSRFLSYNTNAYVLRSSVSLDENSDIGGGSMVVAPDGEVLLDMKSTVGVGSVEIDISKKYLKPAGFGNPPAAHYEYIEKGRRPWKYRPSGSAIVRPNDIAPYPRVCAHRGFSTVAPENSMPSFGAAVAMGADEIEFDIWETLDGEIVSCHDATLDRVSDGTGRIYEHTYEEVLSLDFGSKFSEKFEKLRILRFEDILKKFSCHVIMNIHIKTKDSVCEFKRETLEKIISLVRKYDCERYVYFMCGNDNVLRMLQEMCPDICRCCGAGRQPWEIVDRAIRYGCKKVQLFKPNFNREMIEKAHENGILCNVFWSDDPCEAIEFLDMGIDTILTNDFNIVNNAVKEYIRNGERGCITD